MIKLHLKIKKSSKLLNNSIKKYLPAIPKQNLTLFPNPDANYMNKPLSLINHLKNSPPKIAFLQILSWCFAFRHNLGHEVKVYKYSKIKIDNINTPLTGGWDHPLPGNGGGQTMDHLFHRTQAITTSSKVRLAESAAEGIKSQMWHQELIRECRLDYAEYCKTLKFRGMFFSRINNQWQFRCNLISRIWNLVHCKHCKNIILRAI